jgi:lipoate-protein ligase B
VRTAWLVPCGRLRYGDAWALQKSVLAARQADSIPDVVLSLEHPPVITLGRAARASNVLAAPALLASRGIEVFQVERGGDVTYHGPGQLIGYPIMDLRGFGEDVGRYVRTLEAALIGALHTWDIAAERLQGYPGVWSSGAKVAAIGVAIKRKVTLHGFALNVDPDLAAFDLINPCGLGRPVTSIARLIGRPVALDEAAPAVEHSLAAAMDVRFERRSLDELRAVLPEDAARPAAAGEQPAGMSSSPADGGSEPPPEA